MTSHFGGFDSDKFASVSTYRLAQTCQLSHDFNRLCSSIRVDNKHFLGNIIDKCFQMHSAFFMLLQVVEVLR